jgi:prepilin-type N-terminal cleavage/methylation domain-containing protein
MKKAFTMIELVFVIVVIGILAAVIIPNMRTNPLYEAATQVISHIRYTQHLAMVDDKFDSVYTVNHEWYKKRWQIAFSTGDNYANNKPSYLIFRDNDADTNPDKIEIAKNSLDPSKYLTGGVSGESTLDIRDSDAFEGTKALNLGESYNIMDIKLSSSCSTGTKIAFDHLGRPLRGPLASYDSAYHAGRLVTSVCNITLVASEGNLTIAIQPETGYACILNDAGTECI